MVKDRIIELETNISAHLKTREKLLIKLREQKQKEKLNSYGLDLDSLLQVRVVEARDLMPMDFNGKSDPYVVLKFGTQT